MKPSKKLNFTINSSEKVCSHLHEFIDKESEIIPKPYIIGISAEHYTLTWYCELCCQQYSLPTQGVFLFDFHEDKEEYDDLASLKELYSFKDLKSYVDSLLNFKVSEVCDSNPFLAFDKDEGSTPKHVNQELFYSLSRLNDEKVEQMVEKTLMVPFGTEVVLDDSNNK